MPLLPSSVWDLTCNSPSPGNLIGLVLFLVPNKRASTASLHGFRGQDRRWQETWTEHFMSGTIFKIRFVSFDCMGAEDLVASQRF